jgi:hypothetical protein
MTAKVIVAFTHEHNRRDVARQEFDLAKEHYRHVRRTMDCRDPASVERFQEASRLRSEAFERYIEVVLAS